MRGACRLHAVSKIPWEDYSMTIIDQYLSDGRMNVTLPSVWLKGSSTTAPP